MKKQITKFKAGQTYTTTNNCYVYLCVEVTDNEVTFKRQKIRKGKIRNERMMKLKIMGKREACHKAVIFSWYVDRKRYNEFIFAA